MCEYNSFDLTCKIHSLVFHITTMSSFTHTLTHWNVAWLGRWFRQPISHPSYSLIHKTYSHTDSHTPTHAHTPTPTHRHPHTHTQPISQKRIMGDWKNLSISRQLQLSKSRSGRPNCFENRVKIISWGKLLHHFNRFLNIPTPKVMPLTRPELPQIYIHNRFARFQTTTPPIIWICGHPKHGWQKNKQKKSCETQQQYHFYLHLYPLWRS